MVVCQNILRCSFSPEKIFCCHLHLIASIKWFFLNPLSTNFTKWSNILKQFLGKLQTDCLSVFDRLVGFALKALNACVCWLKYHTHNVYIKFQPFIPWVICLYYVHCISKIRIVNAKYDNANYEYSKYQILQKYNNSKKTELLNLLDTNCAVTSSRSI